MGHLGFLLFPSPDYNDSLSTQDLFERAQNPGLMLFGSRFSRADQREEAQPAGTTPGVSDQPMPQWVPSGSVSKLTLDFLLPIPSLLHLLSLPRQLERQTQSTCYTASFLLVAQLWDLQHDRKPCPLLLPPFWLQDILLGPTVATRQALVVIQTFCCHDR